MNKTIKLGILAAVAGALTLVGVFGMGTAKAVTSPAQSGTIHEVVILPTSSFTTSLTTNTNELCTSQAAGAFVPSGATAFSYAAGSNTLPVPAGKGVDILNNPPALGALQTVGSAVIQQTLNSPFGIPGASPQVLVELPTSGSMNICVDTAPVFSSTGAVALPNTGDMTFDSHGAGQNSNAKCGFVSSVLGLTVGGVTCINYTGNGTTQLEIPVLTQPSNTTPYVVTFTCGPSGTLPNTALPYTITEGPPFPGAPASTFQFLVQCKGSAANIVSLTATPTTVEIVPAPSNTSSSLIQLTVTDSNGGPVFPGQVVDWTTDRCAVSAGVNPYFNATTSLGALSGSLTGTSTILNGVDLTGGTGLGPGFSDVTRSNLATLVANLNTANPASYSTWETAENIMFVRGLVTGQAVQSILYDSGFSTTTGLPTVSRTAVILGCNPGEVGSTPTPGVANVTAMIETNGLFSGAFVGAIDIVKTVQVTVVGPPASITVSASPTSLRCGEKSTITVTVKDSIGQNVSDHTVVELVTNVGGTIGGTGAVAGFGGPVVPISSSVAGTFGGVATAFLLTSEVTSGPYEVVATSGGTAPGVAEGLFSINPAVNGATQIGFIVGGGLPTNGLGSNLFPSVDLNQAVATPLGGVFSTPPVSAQTTVNCSIPTVAAPAAAAPEVQAPRTGTGITPPNTGDAGLAATSTSGSSWALFALIGGVAFALAGIATLKFARR